MIYCSNTIKAPDAASGWPEDIIVGFGLLWRFGSSKRKHSHQNPGRSNCFGQLHLRPKEDVKLAGAAFGRAQTQCRTATSSRANLQLSPWSSVRVPHPDPILFQHINNTREPKQTGGQGQATPHGGNLQRLATAVAKPNNTQASSMDGHSSQQVPPALFSLSPELAHHVLQYLSKRDKQQFSLSCKHASVCALASIRSLVLSHKVLAHRKALKLKTVRRSYPVLTLRWHPALPGHMLSTCRAPAVLQMKYCAGVTLRPRAMDELTKLASLLLVHNLHRFPNLTNLRLELLVGVLALRAHMHGTPAGQQGKAARLLHTSIPSMIHVAAELDPVTMLSAAAGETLCWAPYCMPCCIQGVYDKQCDVSLILKSVVLHAKQLTGLHIEQEAQVSMKALAYTAELPLLERLSVRTRSG